MLEHVPCFVIAVAGRVRHVFAPTQYVFISGEAAGRFGEGTVPFESGELYRRSADDTPCNVLLHPEDVLDLGIVGLGPDAPPVAASVSAAFTRTRPPARRTLPSSKYRASS